ncbi:hypothetical protein MA16_Dca022887 [Dendrobium catenatum]|uniref:Uncharacterized protein n=1 Tax=Dendrobium catenatum TaxID=906689 RepID=A0A2I0VVU5_9ASPA|nr:hypothetical protein MA16_Dca022887 [Dendrobium catenatum]
MVGNLEKNSVLMASEELPSSNKFKMLSQVFAEELTRLDAEVVRDLEPMKQYKVNKITTDIEDSGLERRNPVSLFSIKLNGVVIDLVQSEDGEFVPNAETFDDVEKELDINSNHKGELYRNMLSIGNSLNLPANSLNPNGGIYDNKCDKDIIKSKSFENNLEVMNAGNDFSGVVGESSSQSFPNFENGRTIAIPPLVCKEIMNDDEGFIEGENKI